MRLMNLKTLMRRLPAAALCAALCVSRVSAYSGAAKALDAVPAADTTSAAIGMISTAVNRRRFGAHHRGDEPGEGGN